MTIWEEPLRRKISIFAIIFASLFLVGLLSVSAFAINRKSSPKKQSKASDAPSLGFYMTSNNERPKVGDQFDTKLYASTGSQATKAISALVKYDPASLSVIAVSSAPKADKLASPPVQGFDETFACGPSNGCRNDNQIAFALTNTGQITSKGDGFYIGTIRFKALKPGATTVSYAPEVQQTGFLNPDASAQAVLNTRQIKNLTMDINK